MFATWHMKRLKVLEDWNLLLILNIHVNNSNIHMQL